jgi:large subunit ribosomal protein L23
MDVLIKPIVTEKFTAMSESDNRYGFLVDKRANKIQIKKAVEEMYNVTVKSVNTMIAGGKYKSRYTKGGVISGKTASTKRAVITLAKGETIDFYSNI